MSDRLITADEAKAMRELLPGDLDIAEYDMFDRMAKWLPYYRTYAAAPDLASTVITQDQQIKRLQAALREAEVQRRQVWAEMGADIDPHGAVDWETQYDALTAEDMEETDE